jgi:hypothetical protein
MISHGASAINVSFIVSGDQVEEAVRALHREFFHEGHEGYEADQAPGVLRVLSGSS